MEQQQILNRIGYLLSTRSEEDQLQILNLLEGKSGLPLSVFSAPLSTLEILVKYLIEVEKKTPKEISQLLDRKLSTIYATYTQAQKKYDKALDLSDTSLCIPFHIFSDRTFTLLEHLIAHLHVQEKLSLQDIAQKINRSYSTVKTTCWKYKQKLKKKQ